MADCVLQPCKSSIVEERRLHGYVAKRRGPEFVPVSRIARDLFESEIFVLSGPVEDYVSVTHTKGGRNLRNTDHVISKIAEHLVRLPSHRVTVNTPALSKKDYRSLLLRHSHRRRVTA